jgi:hypothetical protein
MSTHIYGIKPADQKFADMKLVWDTCEKMGISPPQEVWEFFGKEEPDPAGVITELPAECITPIEEEFREGCYIDIRKLPLDVKIIKFVNSY